MGAVPFVSTRLRESKRSAPSAPFLLPPRRQSRGERAVHAVPVAAGAGGEREARRLRRPRRRRAEGAKGARRPRRSYRRCVPGSIGAREARRLRRPYRHTAEEARGAYRPDGPVTDALPEPLALERRRAVSPPPSRPCVLVRSGDVHGRPLPPPGPVRASSPAEATNWSRCDPASLIPAAFPTTHGPRATPPRPRPGVGCPSGTRLR